MKTFSNILVPVDFGEPSERALELATDLAKQSGFKVTERHMKPEELANFDECFLTGTAAEVTPVSEVGEYRFKPGAACAKLINAYTEAVTPKKVAAE